MDIITSVFGRAPQSPKDYLRQCERDRECAEQYRTYVHGLEQGTGPSEIIQNNIAMHSSVVIAAVIRQAKKDAWIFTDRLPPGLYGLHEVLGSVREFLARDSGTHLQIAAYEYSLSAGMIESLKRLPIDYARITFRALTKDAWKRSGFRAVISDDGSYWYNFGSADEYHAIAQFRAKNYPKNIRKTFDSALELSELQHRLAR